CAADGGPVLLVAFDVQAVGALASVTRSSGLLAAAFVVSPVAGPRSRAAFDLELVGGASVPEALRSDAARSLRGNAMADVLPFAEALALDRSEPLELPLSASLAIRLSPVGL
ncbi:MAG TPA: hypothetical protein VFF72_08510, partial [Caldimonas sp.]|nr:hypothetical protein [Caldimonas sp.]